MSIIGKGVLFRAGGGARMWVFSALLGLGLSASAGCNMMKALALVAAPTTQKVAPEYKDLPGKKVLVYVWADRQIQWEYTKLRLDLSAYLGNYLEKNVKGVVVIDPLRVEKYIEQQRTMEVDPVALGRQFNAEVVIHLSVFQFSVRDPEMAHFYRGRLGASVQVHDLSKTNEPEVVTLRNVKVTVPEEGSVGVANATAAEVRQQTYNEFTVEVGKKFHEWDREIN